MEKYLDPSQGWMSRLSGKEICVGMMWSISNNMTELLTRLMREQSVFYQKTSLASCLMCACKRGHEECVRILLEDLRVPIDVSNKAGLTPGQVTTNPNIIKLLKHEQNRSQAYLHIKL